MNWKDKLSIGIIIALPCLLLFGYCVAHIYGECKPDNKGERMVCKR